jgi:hypothetical protein
MKNHVQKDEDYGEGTKAGIPVDHGLKYVIGEDPGCEVKVGVIILELFFQKVIEFVNPIAVFIIDFVILIFPPIVVLIAVGPALFHWVPGRKDRANKLCFRILA